MRRGGGVIWRMSDFLKRFHFEPDGCSTLADELCAFIKDEIAFGRLKAGEPIPTIKEFAEKSGLSFRIARGVVERLAHEGYVRSRPRVGTVVLPRDIAVLHGRVLFAMPDVDASSYHVTQIADALRRRLSAAGYVFSTVVFSQDGQDSLAFLKREFSRTPDLVITMYGTPQVQECLRDAGVRRIFVYGEEPEDDDCWWIRFSSVDAVANFAGHCVRAGVKRVTQVGCIGNYVEDVRAILSTANIESRFINVSIRDDLGRYEGIERSAYNMFLDMPRSEFPDVFLFWDDYAAQGALTAFLKRGVRVPGDVKFVTLSNKGLGPVYPEALTRIECDPRDTGEKVADFALSVLAKGRIPPPPVISPQYVFGSTFPY